MKAKSLKHEGACPVLRGAPHYCTCEQIRNPEPFTFENPGPGKVKKVKVGVFYRV